MPVAGVVCFLIFPLSQDSFMSASDIILQTDDIRVWSFVWKTFIFPSMNLISKQKHVCKTSRGQQRALTEQFDVTFTHHKLRLQDKATERCRITDCTYWFNMLLMLWSLVRPCGRFRLGLPWLSTLSSSPPFIPECCLIPCLVNDESKRPSLCPVAALRGWYSGHRCYSGAWNQMISPRRPASAGGKPTRVCLFLKSDMSKHRITGWCRGISFSSR